VTIRIILALLLVSTAACQEEDKNVVTIRVTAPAGATVTFTSPCSGEAVRGTAADLLRGTPVEILIENWGADGVASVFDHWEGDVPAMDRYTNPLRIVPERDLRLSAVNAAGWTTETAAAEFFLLPSTGTAPLEVSFDAGAACWAGGCPEEGILWWSFGDGFTSKELAPVHVYETPGIYPVTLRPRSELGGPPPVTRPDAVVVLHPTLGSPYWYQCQEFDRGLLDNLPAEETLARALLDEVNRLRADAGRGALAWDPVAATAARAEVEDRLQRNWSGETSPEGWSLGDRLELMVGHSWESVAAAQAPGPATPWDLGASMDTDEIDALGAGSAGVGVRAVGGDLVSYAVIIAHDGPAIEPTTK
jgi:hypothetical protein